MKITPYMLSLEYLFYEVNSNLPNGDASSPHQGKYKFSDFDYRYTQTDIIFEVARRIGQPIEFKNSHFYFSFRGTQRIICWHKFHQFIEYCLRRLDGKENLKTK